MDSLDTTESIAVLSVSGYDDHSFDNHTPVQDIHEDDFDATSSNFRVFLNFEQTSELVSVEF